MTRNEQILQKAHELAKRAIVTIDTKPMSTLVATAVDSATWADATMIDKACEWLRNSGIIHDNSGGYDSEYIITKFKESMYK